MGRFWRSFGFVVVRTDTQEKALEVENVFNVAENTN